MLVMERGLMKKMFLINRLLERSINKYYRMIRGSNKTVMRWSVREMKGGKKEVKQRSLLLRFSRNTGGDIHDLCKGLSNGKFECLNSGQVRNIRKIKPRVMACIKINDGEDIHRYMEKERAVQLGQNIILFRKEQIHQATGPRERFYTTEFGSNTTNFGERKKGL